MYSKSKLNCDDGTEKEVIAFGPLAIHPEYQRQGYGKKLVDYSLNKATKLGYPCVFISGDINFIRDVDLLFQLQREFVMQKI